MIDSDDRREFAKTLLTKLVPDANGEEAGLANAIRTELLVTALQDRERPDTLYDLWRVLRRLAAGQVAEELVAAVARRVDQEPDVPLADIA